MAEKVPQSADVPNFDTYPAEPLLPEHATRTALEDKARRVGETLGRAVVTLREAGDALKGISGEARGVAATRIDKVTSKAREAGSRITEMAGTVRNKAAHWGGTITSNVQGLGQATVERARDVRSQVKSGYFQARVRTRQAVREYPVHAVLMAGAVGFLLGVGLRIWRSSRES
jgi:ElaB/YqjD/DUF883 family membrane-anchored ribosome-binding protein